MNLCKRRLRVPTGVRHLSWTLLSSLIAAPVERNPFVAGFPDKL
jgi:hypothetical protein